MLLEEQRGQVDEVVAPGEPAVQAGSLDLGDGQAAGVEEGDEAAVGLEQAVLVAAGDRSAADPLARFAFLREFFLGLAFLLLTVCPAVRTSPRRAGG